MATIKDKNKKVILKPKKKTIVNIKSKAHEEIEYWADRIKEDIKFLYDKYQ